MNVELKRQRIKSIVEQVYESRSWSILATSVAALALVVVGWALGKVL